MPKFAVKIGRATSLAMGGQKPDAYVKLKLGSQQKQKTKVVKGFDPIWNEWFDYDKWNKDEKLVVEVMHYNHLNTNLLLGKIKFNYPDDKTGHTKARVPLELEKSFSVRGQVSYLELEIVNISLKHRQAAMQYNVSSEEGESLIRKMMQGCDWKLHDKKNDKLKVRDVTIFYGGSTQEDGYPIGSIMWTSTGATSAPKPSDLSSKHVLAVHTITDVYVGPPCEHAIGYSGDKDLCISFKGEKTFNFVADKDTNVDTWLKGLRYAISSKGKKCSSVEVKGSSASGAKNNSTTWDHPANEAVQSMLNGCDMVAYSNEAKPRKDDVFVFFSRGGGKYGSIYWSDGGKREDRDKCILLHQLTDIYVGKQQKIFQGPIASGVEDQCCFSIVSKRSGKRVQLHIQAQSVSVMKTWMVGINHILTTIGRKVVLESESGEKKTTATGRRFSRHFSVAVRAKSTHPGVLKMADGAYFTRYRLKKSKKDRSVKTQVFVFHSRLGGVSEIGTSQTGALFWYEKTDKTKELPEERKKDRRCIPVQSITDIYCGKQHDIFKTKSANEANDACVFSVRGAEVSKGNKENFLLHLEAESPEIVKTWMDAIAHLLKGGGRSVEQVAEGGEKDKTSQPGGGEGEPKKKTTTRGKRMSVAPPSGDALDMLGFNTALTEPKAEDIDGFFPATRPDNPFDDASGAWDPFSDAPAAAPPPASDDLSAFFGDMGGDTADPGSPKAPGIDEVPVLFPGQDSVWGSGATDPFASPDQTDMFGASTQSDPFGAPSGGTSDDPFGAPPLAFGAPDGGTDPFGSSDFSAAPPATNNDFGDIFGAPTQPMAPIQTSAPPEGAGEMLRFLMSIGLADYAKKFEEEKIDLDALNYFSKDDLKELGLPTGPAIKILKTLPNWKG